MDIREDKPPPWDLELQAAGVGGNRGTEGWGDGGGVGDYARHLGHWLRWNVLFFLCRRGWGDSCWKLASAITSTASFILRDSVHDSEVARQALLSGTLEEKVQFQDQEASRGCRFQSGAWNKDSEVVWSMRTGSCSQSVSARSYLLLPLEQQTDYVTDYDSEYDSCSSRPFVCLSWWLAACFSVCLSVCLQHVVSPWEPLGDRDYPYIFLKSRMCKKNPKKHYI